MDVYRQEAQYPLYKTSCFKAFRLPRSLGLNRIFTILFLTGTDVSQYGIITQPYITTMGGEFSGTIQLGPITIQSSSGFS